MKKVGSLLVFDYTKTRVLNIDCLILSPITPGLVQDYTHLKKHENDSAAKALYSLRLATIPSPYFENIEQKICSILMNYWLSFSKLISSVSAIIVMNLMM